MRVRIGDNVCRVSGIVSGVAAVCEMVKVRFSKDDFGFRYDCRKSLLLWGQSRLFLHSLGAVFLIQTLIYPRWQLAFLSQLPKVSGFIFLL